MELETGGVYLIENDRTKQSQYFHLQELITYKAQAICYGYTDDTDIRIYRGQRRVAGKPVSFTLLSDESTVGALRLTVLLGALPLYIYEVSGLTDLAGQPLKPHPADGMAIVHMDSRLARQWGGDNWTADKRPNRDGLVRKQQKVIDLYWWLRQGKGLPAWFTRDMDLLKRNN